MNTNAQSMYLIVTQSDPSVFNLRVETINFFDFRILNRKRNLLPRVMKVVSSAKKISGTNPPILLKAFLGVCKFLQYNLQVLFFHH